MCDKTKADEQYLKSVSLIEEYEREHGKVFDFHICEFCGEIEMKKYHDTLEREHLIIPDFVSGVKFEFGEPVFYGIRYLKSIELGKGMCDLSDMFYGSDMEEIDLSSWDVSNVIDMSYMFSESKLKSIGDISSCNVSNVDNMHFMVCESAVENIGDIASWDVSNVKDMFGMFFQSKLKDVGELGSWNVSKVENMSCMFTDSKLTYIGDISGWNTSKVKWMIRMFDNVHLSDIGNIGLWDVSNVWEM